MTTSYPVRVVGVGSRHGDDAVGLEVIRALQQEVWDERVQLHAVAGGQRLLDLLDGTGSLILVDAVADATNAGNLQRLVWPDARLEILRPGCTHDLRPAAALELATALGVLSPRVVVWAITGQSFAPASGLTPRVAATLPDLCECVRSEIRAQLDPALCQDEAVPPPPNG